MKRFIIISLLWAVSLTLLACAWPATHNYYLFSPCANDEFNERMDKLTRDNWQAYIGSTAEYYYFDADEVIAAARKKNDALMVSYVEQLQRYLACADEKRNERWEYPTKAQLAKRTQTLKSVRAYAQGKLRTRLRSQHALLYMRCNMMLGLHQKNVDFYQQTASKFIESVYRDMMENIYAGALLKTGRSIEAADIFARQGDWQSLMTQFYKRRSYDAIRQEYLRDPDSAVLPFLLKDFVNNAQEAVDGDDVMPGKLFVRNIQQKEAMQMCQLATQVVQQRKSQHLAMWQSAKAWLQFLFGKRQQAARDILEAVGMSGTERMQDNVRVLMLYITAAESPASQRLDDFLATELAWLDTKVGTDDRFYRNALDRLVHQVLAQKYERQPLRAVSILRAADSQYYDTYVDTMQVGRLQQYIDYLSAPATTALDGYLKPRQKADMQALNDLVGTKYMRLCQWQQAQQWLAKVPLTYYNNKGYAVYAANRRYTIEPWVTRQWLKEGMEYSDRKWQLKSNPKLVFAAEMQKMEGELSILSGQARQQRCYDLAVRYAQASFTGDCWFLMRDGKSWGDSVRVNEVCLADKALALLATASLSADAALKERALFAMSYGGLYQQKWYNERWDAKTYDAFREPNPASRNYKAFAALADFERTTSKTVSLYVSRCDEYRQFLKHYHHF